MRLGDVYVCFNPLPMCVYCRGEYSELGREEGGGEYTGVVQLIIRKRKEISMAFYLYFIYTGVDH